MKMMFVVCKISLLGGYSLQSGLLFSKEFLYHQLASCINAPMFLSNCTHHTKGPLIKLLWYRVYVLFYIVVRYRTRASNKKCYLKITKEAMKTQSLLDTAAPVL